MSDRIDAASCPWIAGRIDGSRRAPTLLFRRMFEDWTLEESVFAGRRRVLCIASGGCTAIALANRGHRVTAVDVNPAQIASVRRRLAARGKPRCSRPMESEPPASVERALRMRLWALRALGVASSLVQEFVDCDSVARQVQLWDRLCSRRVRLALRAVLHPSVLRLTYARPFVRALPQHFSQTLLTRMRRGIARWPNRDNPFIGQLLTGRRSPRLDPALQPGRTIELVCDEVASYLERSAPGSFEAFSLSNIPDGCDEGYARRLVDAVYHAAAPGAVVVIRSFCGSPEPGSDWSAHDRAHLWGSVHVERVERRVASNPRRSPGGLFGRPIPPPPLEVLGVPDVRVA